MKEFYSGDIRVSARRNTSFRRVVFTGEHSQLVLMSLSKGEEIGAEVHSVDQLLLVVEGYGSAVVGGSERAFNEGALVCVPAGVEHNIVNTGAGPLKLLTVYAPAQHPAETVRETRAEAIAAERTPVPA